MFRVEQVQGAKLSIQHHLPPKKEGTSTVRGEEEVESGGQSPCQRFYTQVFSSLILTQKECSQPAYQGPALPVSGLSCF